MRMNRSSKATQLLITDLLENILSHSNNPGECGKYITTQIRELIGVKIVALMQNPIVPGSNKCSIISVCPERHMEIIKNREIENICLFSRSKDSIFCLEKDNKNLSSLALGDSIIIPLIAGGEHIGVLLLLDMFSTEGMASVLEALQNLAGVIGLIFRNSILFNSMDQLVEERTSELKKEIQMRIKTEQELSKLQNYLSNIIDSMPSILIGVDAVAKVILWNKTAENYTGIEASSALGKPFSTVFSYMESDVEKITKSIRSKEIQHELKVLNQENQAIKYEEVTIYPLATKEIEGAVIRVDDVTEKIRIEEMMIQNEKMLSVGGLAAGMAHEINNPLAGMIQTVSVMGNRLGNSINMPANIKAAKEVGINIKDIKKFMEIRGIFKMISSINESGERMTGIINNMLSFARKSEGLFSSYSINDLIDSTVKLAATDYNLKKHYDFRKIKIERNFEENLPLIQCDFAKIQQVILNILQNGAHAMAMDGKGIEGAHFILETRLERETNQLIIIIEDNGPGIPEGIRKRIFEPFFTTKPIGIGTGLGLSVSYYIITENHKGEMKVESQPGNGTKFIIKLPVGDSIA